MDGAEEADAGFAHHHLRALAHRAARHDHAPGRTGRAEARSLEAVGDRGQGDLALGRGAYRLEHGRARIEDDTFARQDAQGGERTNGALLAMLELRIEGGFMLECRLQGRHEESAAMRALEIAAFGELLEIAPDGRGRGADLLGELEDRGRAVAAQTLEDHGAALGRDDLNPL